MAGWLDMLAPAAFRNRLTRSGNPSQVQEVKQNSYIDRIIHCREDSIVLYGPTNDKYEIVLNRPTTERNMDQAFSLFRSDNVQAAEDKFILLKDKIPVIAEVAKETCCVATLQKLCDVTEQNPGWTAAHVVAHFDLHTCFNSELISKYINSTDPYTGLSPLFVAIQAQNLQTISVLLAKNASLEHLDNEANSVFHYAASTNEQIISALASTHLQLKCLNYRNSKGHTPLHMACLADKPECVKALLLAGADCNISAEKGNFLTSDTTQPGLVGNFLQENPNKLYAQDMKYGGTPLHWSCSREVIESLLDMGCHINALNFDGRSALHIMVMRERRECIRFLLARGADMNIRDCDGNTPLHLAVISKRLECVMILLSHGAELNIQNVEGNTPLHLAVLNLSIPIVQGLIIFGGDLNVINNSGASPRHAVLRERESGDADRVLYILHAVGARRCSPDMSGCSPGCAANENHNGTAPPKPPIGSTRTAVETMLSTASMNLAAQRERKKRSHALCLDGGGIRGLLLIVMLRELERAAGKPILHCFDWVAGTSTGGILALGLAVGKSLHECLCLYIRMKDIAFVGRRPYESEPLENMLKECLGAETVMAEITHPKLMITGVLADRSPVDLHIFRNYMSPSHILGHDEHKECHFKAPPLPQDQYLWRAARASGAAPSYFRAFGRFLDGGLIANNPTLDCLTEIHEYNLAMQSINMDSEVAPVTLVVSLGTGNVPVTELTDVDVFRPDSLWGATKLIVGATTLSHILVDQATQSTGRVVDRARAWCSMIGVPYYRFAPPLSEDINMDERSDEKLVNMMWECQSYMYSQQALVHELAVLLRE